MTISQTSICNKALHFIGIGEEIASIEERSPEAEACLLFYDDVIDEVLREFPWPFARRKVELSTTNETDDDDELIAYGDEYFYAYRMPSDCKYVRRILSGTPVDDPSTLIRYAIASDTTGQLILTDYPEASLEYTARISDASLYPVDFATAVSWRLGCYIAPRLAEDPIKANKLCEVGYERSIRKARSVAASEESEGPPPKSSFERAR